MRFRGLCFAVACFGASIQAAPLKIMPLGDSITAGYNVPGGYRTELYRLLQGAGYDFDFVGSMSDNPSSALPDLNHEGHAGWTILNLSSFIDAWLAAADPDVILLHIGTNDISGGATSKTAATRLNTLIGQITTASPDAHLIVASVVPRLDTLEPSSLAYDRMIPGIVSSYQAQGKLVTFLDMHAALGTTDLGDVVHPNASGYDKMAHAWFPAIESVVPAPPVPEPASLLALAVGVVLVAARRRRR